jgi:hypothetical protein
VLRTHLGSYIVRRIFSGHWRHRIFSPVRWPHEMSRLSALRSRQTSTYFHLPIYEMVVVPCTNLRTDLKNIEYFLCACVILLNAKPTQSPRPYSTSSICFAFLSFLFSFHISVILPGFSFRVGDLRGKRPTGG